MTRWTLRRFRQLFLLKRFVMHTRRFTIIVNSDLGFVPNTENFYATAVSTNSLETEIPMGLILCTKSEQSRSPTAKAQLQL